MRLIDADALIELLEEKMFNSEAMCPVIKITDVLEIVDEQPTAYDVEKVVMNLRCDTNCPNCSLCCADAIICGFDECLKQAIEIVRKGGVE